MVHIYGIRSTLYRRCSTARRSARVGGAMPRPVPPEGRWTDRHRVISFYAPADLIAWIDEERRRSGRSKTQVIVAALEKERQPKAPSPRRQQSRRKSTGS